MERITLNNKYSNAFVSQKEVQEIIQQKQEALNLVLQGHRQYTNDLGWHQVEQWGFSELEHVQKVAKDIQSKADVFVLIGVGGSNQGARAAIKALGSNGDTEVIYAGNNLSGHYLNQLIESLEGKSVYLNCIAKNFATLEPGIAFRVLRHYIEERYGKDEAANRITVTCSMNDSSLQRLGENNGYNIMPFPLDIGGRYSVLSPVGLLPMAVAGIPIDEILKGGRDMEAYIKNTPLDQNDAIYYAVARNILLDKGFKIELLSCFEPSMEYFAKWWIQLFGESQGKEGTGLFPSSCHYSEDLHSMGQYIQEGPRILIETFLNINEPIDNIKLKLDHTDGFDYVDNRDLEALNKAAYDATIKAHAEGGIPCFEVNIPQISPYYMGQLFYFFMMACYASSELLEINPFDQDGVENYKYNMFTTLKES